jgi:large subunit ribosomal protein L32
MAVPKKKTSRSRTGMRRSHHAIKFTAAVDYCPSCSAPKLRHHICLACGAYRGMQIRPAPVSAVADGPTVE